uniref:Uncharacterized protein n=1 Tax=Nelumbo nucifera TaxID=4432 RepID=A0A822YBI3_NELNU|nr:TPA_asm: hypothetical protein HUJ06_030137 [Nelumbo nucifera]
MRRSMKYLATERGHSSLVFFPLGKSDLAAERTTPVALRLAVGGRSLLWNTTVGKSDLAAEHDRANSLSVPRHYLREQPSHRLASSWQRTHQPNPRRSLRKSDAAPHAYPPA